MNRSIGTSLPFQGLFPVSKFLSEVGRDVHKASSYCAMCGRSACRHGVMLMSINSFPRTISAHQDFICEECNAGIGIYLQPTDPPWMDGVRSHQSVHIRLGETLKAFKGEPVAAATLDFVANQDDWKKRVRELRYLGWEIETFNRKLSGGRVSSYYRLVKSCPWPEDPTRIIRRYERDRAERNRVDD